MNKIKVIATVILITILIVIIYTSIFYKENSTDISSDRIYNYLKLYRRDNGVILQNYSVDQKDRLYNTYYTVKIANLIDENNGDIQVSLKTLLNKPINEVIDFNSTDYISYVYFYTEICKSVNYSIDLNDKLLLISKINEAYKDGFYYYSSSKNFNKDAFQTAYLYSTELAVKALANLEYKEFSSDIFNFSELFENEYILSLDTYKKLMAYRTLVELKTILKIDCSQTIVKISELIESNLDVIKNDFSASKLDAIYFDLILELCELTDIEIFNQNEKNDYFNSIILTSLNDKIDDFNIIITYIALKNIKQISDFKTLKKEEIAILDKILDYKLLDGSYSTYGSLENSFEQAYYYLKITEILGQLDFDLLEKFSESKINDNMDFRQIYFLMLINDDFDIDISKEDIPITFYDRCKESLELNDLETELSFVQFINTILIGDIIDMTISNSKMIEVTKKIDNDFDKNINKKIMSLAIKALLEIEEDYKSELIKVHELIINSENLAETLSPSSIYYYYTIADYASINFNYSKYSIVDIKDYINSIDEIFNSVDNYESLQYLFYLILPITKEDLWRKH